VAVLVDLHGVTVSHTAAVVYITVPVMNDSNYGLLLYSMPLPTSHGLESQLPSEVLCGLIDVRTWGFCFGVYIDVRTSIMMCLPQLNFFSAVGLSVDFECIPYKVELGKHKHNLKLC